MTRLYKSTDQHLMSNGVQYSIGSTYEEAETMKTYANPLDAFRDNPLGRIFEVEDNIFHSNGWAESNKITFIKEIDYAPVFKKAILGGKMEYRKSILFNPQMPADMMVSWVFPVLDQNEKDILARTTDRLDIQLLMMKEKCRKPLLANRNLHKEVIDMCKAQGLTCCLQTSSPSQEWKNIMSRDNIKIKELRRYFDNKGKWIDIINIFEKCNIYSEKWLLSAIPEMTYAIFTVAAPMLKLKTVDIIFKDLPYERKDVIIKTNKKVRKRVIESWQKIK